ncbi:MAG: hypothetical protein IJ642_01695 [Oscillospiraceae bacterium]|nr:hypothetical protein [Oscillospiraceae bacterium]
MKKHARILYEAGQGAESLTELCRRAAAGKAAVSSLLEKYTVCGAEVKKHTGESKGEGTAVFPEQYQSDFSPTVFSKFKFD